MKEKIGSLQEEREMQIAHLIDHEAYVMMDLIYDNGMK